MLVFLLACAVAVRADQPAVFGLDIHSAQKTTPSVDINKDIRRILRKRDPQKRSTVSLGAIPDSIDMAYYVNISFGTPPQNVSLNLDLTSADTWVNAPSSEFCRNSTNGCALYGTYSANASSTYTFISSGFNIPYDDPTTSVGDYITDTVWISRNASLRNFQFGVAYNSTNHNGILGLGFPIQEVQVSKLGKQPYPNLPQALANAGLINANAFSLWLNDRTPSGGSILFGGVDHDKYIGELRTIAFSPITKANAQYIVPVTDIQFNHMTVITGETRFALDPGYSLSYFPDNVTDVLYPMAGVTYNSTSELAYIDCAQGNNQTTLDLTLSWPQLNVTLGQLVVPYDDPTTGTKDCLFGILKASSNLSGLFVIGQTILRSAYIVFDLDNNELSIAQTRFNVTTTNITEINSGINGVPGALRVPSSTPAASVHGHSLSSGTKAAIAVVVAIGVIGLLTVITIFIYTRRRKEMQNFPTNDEKPYEGKPELPAVSKPRYELHGQDVCELSQESSSHEIDEISPSQELFSQEVSELSTESGRHEVKGDLAPHTVLSVVVTPEAQELE
jgi:aspartyl protease